jgi:uncharacterized protein (DUF2336 family)
MTYLEDAAVEGGATDHRGSRWPSILSLPGIKRLRLNPPVQERVEIATSVGAAFAGGDLSAQELDIAAQILETLCQDTDLKVRQAVCDQVFRCPFVPPGIVRVLAHDVESIAVPIVRCSEALSDGDLIALIRDGDTLRQVSVARREIVSVPVTDELVGTGKRTVVKTVLANDGADLSEKSLTEVIDAFGEVPSVQSLLVGRPALPDTIKQRLASLVPPDLAQRLAQRHRLQGDQDPARLTLVGERGTSRGVETAAEAGGRVWSLTPLSMLRALCVGKLDLFVQLMASSVGIPARSVRAVVDDHGADGFRGLYRHSGLTDELFPAFRTALDVVLEVERTGRGGWNAAADRRIVDELARACGIVPHGGLDSVFPQLSLRLPENQQSEDAAP